MKIGIQTIKEGAKRLAGNLAAFVTAAENECKAAIEETYPIAIEDMKWFDFDREGDAYYGAFTGQSELTGESTLYEFRFYMSGDRAGMIKVITASNSEPNPKPRKRLEIEASENENG
jgi:hypothetical protein